MAEGPTRPPTASHDGAREASVEDSKGAGGTPKGGSFLADTGRGVDGSSPDPCAECGEDVIGTWIEIPYRGDRIPFFVRICRCGLELQSARVTQMYPACPFCDHVGPSGIPGIRHTHETVEEIW